MKLRIIFILFIFATLGILIVCTSEPRYHGRTLTRWLWQYYSASLEETNRLQEAQNAVRAIGAKKAVPKLLKLVEAKDDPVSSWLIDKTGEWRIRFLKWHSSESYSLEDYERIQWRSAEDFQMLGVRGFEILGTNAAPAVGMLGKILNEQFPDQRHTQVIEWSLESIGKPAEPVVCRALTNSNPAIRQWAVDELASDTDEVEVYIARIKPRLQDSSDAVRRTTVDAIGIQTSAPELAVPLLVEALKDSSTSVNAANALANFGTNALFAFPILTNLVENGNDGTAGAALKTLIIIAPDRAFPIFTNRLVQAKPWVDAALRALADVRPDKALPIVLARLQSPEVAMRREAFGLLRHYPETLQIDSAMQAATADSDSSLALGAKGFLTEQYETNHPDKFLFPDEPGYNGKQLGEWLETRIEGGGDFTPAAKEAIHQMGTKAIPALLKRLTYQRPPYCFSPFQININAATGFIALGEQAKPALPELWTLMDNTNKETALTAMIATCGTGSNAMPFLIKGLTNQFAEVRNQAANLLTEGIGDKFPEQRKRAIPLFVKLLNDSDDDVRGNATNQLKEIDPATAVKFGIK
jgi:HEAT repeat protein